MIDKRIHNAEQAVQVHYNMTHNVSYRENIRNLIPLPDGYEEIYYGYEGKAYHRDGLEEVTVVSWGSFNYEAFYKTKNSSTEWVINPVWLLKKKDIIKEGQRYLIDENEYIVSFLGKEQFALVNLRTGWSRNGVITYDRLVETLKSAIRVK